jgi:hypothetical protein
MPICPCCGDETLSAQQIRRHLAARQRRLAAALDAMNMEEEDDGPAPHNAGPALDNDYPAPRGESPTLNEVEHALGAIRQRGIDLAALIAREDEDFGKYIMALLLTVNLVTPFAS